MSEDQEKAEAQAQVSAWPRELDARLMRLGKASLDVSLQLGRTRLSMEEILSIEPGSLVETDKVQGGSAEIIVNGTLFGAGEVVVVGENLGVRITELYKPEEK